MVSQEAVKKGGWNFGGTPQSRDRPICRRIPDPFFNTLLEPIYPNGLEAGKGTILEDDRRKIDDSQQIAMAR
jgi:hypothetical protein